MTGVYMIFNKKNGKAYIGSASKCLDARFKQHKSQLRAGRHFNHHLQSAWNKYGEDSFDFEVIQECPPEECLACEQQYIDRFGTYERGYNLRPKVSNNSGVKWSQETKDRMSASAKRRMERPEEIERLRKYNEEIANSPERRRKCGNGMRGKTHTPEVRARISESMKGREVSQKVIETVGARYRGKKLSDEHVAKMKAGRAGTKTSDETKAKMSKVHKARCATPEAKEKLKKAIRARWSNPKAREECRERMRRLWADPEWRAKQIERMNR